MVLCKTEIVSSKKNIKLARHLECLRAFKTVKVNKLNNDYKFSFRPKVTHNLIPLPSAEEHLQLNEHFSGDRTSQDFDNNISSRRECTIESIMENLKPRKENCTYNLTPMRLPNEVMNYLRKQYAN